MSLKDKLKEKSGDQFEDVDDIEELILDALTSIRTISKADKVFLEKFKNLLHLSMNYLGLTTVRNFPSLPSIITVLE